MDSGVGSGVADNSKSARIGPLAGTAGHCGNHHRDLKLKSLITSPTKYTGQNRPRCGNCSLSRRCLQHVTREILNEALGLGVSSEQLLAAVRENVFLTRLAGETETFTYHPLFRDFLRKQLKEETSGERFREMHRELARYYAARENWGLALEHFFEARRRS